MKLRKEIYVMNENKMVYKIESVRELDSNDYALSYTLELVAGFDYINPDQNDIQGFVKAHNFTDDVQAEWLTVFPMEETLKDRLDEEGYKVIDIDNVKIHEGVTAE